MSNLPKMAVSDYSTDVNLNRGFVFDRSNCSVNECLVVSYNLHGMNQERLELAEIMRNLSPGICLVQEHWLTPDNLDQMQTFKGYVFLAILS